MNESDKKQFLETQKNRNTYRVLETFTPPNRNKNWAKKGDTYGSDTIFDWGLNPTSLVEEGKLELLEKEPFEWQKELVGKNVHTVHSWCPQCLSFGVNMPLENECGNCGHTATRTYYDAKTINNYIKALEEKIKEKD